MSNEFLCWYFSYIMTSLKGEIFLIFIFQDPGGKVIVSFVCFFRIIKIILSIYTQYLLVLLVAYYLLGT